MPSFRTSPSALGISLRLIGFGFYLPNHMSDTSSRPCSVHQGSSSWTSSCVADLSALIQHYIRFLFVGSELCPLLISRNNIRLPPDSTSRWTPLPLANASCYRARSGLSPPSYRPCLAHHIKKDAACLSKHTTSYFLLY